MVKQLRSEAQKLRESNQELQVKIKELKVNRAYIDHFKFFCICSEVRFH